MQIRISNKTSAPDWNLFDVLAMLSLSEKHSQKEIGELIGRTAVAVGRKWRETLTVLFAGEGVVSTLEDKHYTRLFAKYGKVYSKELLDNIIAQIEGKESVNVIQPQQVILRKQA